MHSAGDSSLVVVAKCTRCGIVASRLVDDDGTNLAAVVGAEALASMGCPHVDAVVVTRQKTTG
jgi:hypothetical protein